MTDQHYVLAATTYSPLARDFARAARVEPAVGDRLVVGVNDRRVRGVDGVASSRTARTWAPRAAYPRVGLNASVA